MMPSAKLQSYENGDFLITYIPNKSWNNYSPCNSMLEAIDVCHIEEMMFLTESPRVTVLQHSESYCCVELEDNFYYHVKDFLIELLMSTEGF